MLFGLFKKKQEFVMTSFINIKVDDVVEYWNQLVTITDLGYKSSDEGYYYHKALTKKREIHYVCSYDWSTKFKVLKK